MRPIASVRIDDCRPSCRRNQRGHRPQSERSTQASWTRTTRRSPDSRLATSSCAKTMRRARSCGCRRRRSRCTLRCWSIRARQWKSICSTCATRSVRSSSRWPASTRSRSSALGERPTVLSDYTRDAARLDKAIGSVFARSGSGTYILEAIVDASSGMRRRKAARPHIIVYASRGPEFSERYHQSVIDALRESGATLHTLLLTRPGRRVGEPRRAGAREDRS